MSLNILLPDLPDCSVEQVTRTEESILMTVGATTLSASCPDCHHVSFQVHSIYTRSPQALPSSGLPVRLLLHVRRFRCSYVLCQRKTFAEPFPRLIAPRVQSIFSVRDLIRIIGNVLGGEAGARLSQQLAMACSPATMLRLIRQAPLPDASHVRVLGIDEWAWRKRQRYGTILVDLEHHVPIDLLEDATAESVATWLRSHPTIEVISRDRGTTFADGASRGAPQALQIADRWHLLHNMGEALEKVLARHHADLKRACTPEVIPNVLTFPHEGLMSSKGKPTQEEQVQRARWERRLAIFTQIHELLAQGWTIASIARLLHIHKKTAAKFAKLEQFPDYRPRRDRIRKLAPYRPYLHAQWVQGEHNMAFLYQTIRLQGYRGSETSVRTYLTSLREETEPHRPPRRQYLPEPDQKKKQQHKVMSSHRATWLVLHRPEDLSEDDQQMLVNVLQAHTQVKAACLLAQAFAQMIRSQDAAALESWLEQAENQGIPEFRSFAAGIKRDRAAVFAALTLEWSHDYVA